MKDSDPRVAIVADQVAPRRQPSSCPEPFASRMAGRTRRVLGGVFALSNSGVNLTTPAPGAVSSLRHGRTHQDEIVHVPEGRPTLRTDAGDRVSFPVGDHAAALVEGRWRFTHKDGRV